MRCTYVIMSTIKFVPRHLLLLLQCLLLETINDYFLRWSFLLRLEIWTSTHTQPTPVYCQILFLDAEASHSPNFPQIPTFLGPVTLAVCFRIAILYMYYLHAIFKKHLWCFLKYARIISFMWRNNFRTFIEMLYRRLRDGLKGDGGEGLEMLLIMLYSPRE